MKISWIYLAWLEWQQAANSGQFKDSNNFLFIRTSYLSKFHMPEFSWEPLDFLEALGVAPAEEEHGISYSYVVKRKPLNLALTIWPYDGDVELTLRCDAVSEPVVHLNLLGSPGARVIADKRGKCIEFAAANLFTGRYDHTRPAPYGVRLWVEPHLQITTFSYDV